MYRKYTLLSAGPLEGGAPFAGDGRRFEGSPHPPRTHPAGVPPPGDSSTEDHRRLVWSPQPVVPVALQVRSEVLDGVTAAVKAERLYEQFECF